jgi:hypothetical protein
MAGCATTEKSGKSKVKWTPQGTVIWDKEFEFLPPPKEWSIITVEVGGEFGFGFMRVDKGAFPSQSTFVYDEEPFGCSLNFEKRQEEFFKRYLWTTAMTLDMKILEKKKVTVAGGEGLAVVTEGQDPVKKEKVKSKVVFGKRGERVVSWYLTQWRQIDGAYDDSAFQVFDTFWGSFKYLKKSFYEAL